MKILIADDEHLIRLSIRHNLEKLNIPAQSIHEATDGYELLRELERLQPDVAFVDIKMPLLGGLEAIEQGKLVSPYTEFIILTGFSEFDYARKAIALRINEYLLKPASLDQLKAVIHNIMELLERKAEERNRLFTLQIAEIIAATKPAEDNRLPLEGMNCKLVAVCFDGLKETNRLRAEAWLDRARSCAKPYMSQHFHMTIVKPRDNEWILVLGIEKTWEAGNEKLLSCLSEIRHMTAAWRKEQGDNLTLITSNTIPFRLFLSTYGELLQMTCLRALLGISVDYSQSFLKAVIQDKPYYLTVCTLLVELARYQELQSPIEFGSAIERLIPLVEDQRLHENIRVISAMGLFLRCSIGLSVEADGGYSSLKSELLDYSKRLIGSQTDRSQIIRSIVTYANSHYADEISVAKVADLFDISPNYLSTLFHKETGNRFVEYIAELRMKEARKLLLETDLSIHEITRKVGLYSTSHFSKLFTKYYSVSPQEYKKNAASNRSQPPALPE
ncbi:helix-turn-helix domain-containing protein [Paenibacillus radicis (ex Xue et al. 2023)]|uniref:Helix-turn-helix domain-containing protein n=1 Tax=Paenibacillus radicis (ex Xue et al. 2023) TaxID=2972489 RepID=A0ABT1YB75_9BACL|nr:helix-turn-helix domain-containing protein [Paenibacillus radicis (ex Xue et al. 2023)]MCR8630443.1 helix-turn-helix domain-containing protein [Paenibacillus radicis (ex Xue et al. 2023)]